MSHSRPDARVSLKFALVALLATLGFLTLTASASAALDNFLVGDGHEGAYAPTASAKLNYSAPINTASGSTITTGAGRAGTATAAQTQFEAGRLVLVVQSTNYTGSAPSGSQAPIDLNGNNTGRFELARVSSLSGSLAGGYTLNLAGPLDNTYTTGAQVVAVPEFTTVTISTAAVTIDANAWDGDDGGVTAFLATGAITISGAGSKISADGQGFRGGPGENHGAATNCTQFDGGAAGRKGEGIVLGAFGTGYKARGNRANGAGGGDCENAGGGGGGNGGIGGQGGDSYDSATEQWPVGGLGGVRLVYSPLEQAVFGGGGGGGDENNNNAGDGSPGGGFVFVRANSLSGGSLTANGAKGGDSNAVSSGDGAGGGGAGGVVHARFVGTASCSAIAANGGAGGTERSTGGNHGPGGGGGGGRVFLQSSGGSCASTTTAGLAGRTTVGNNTRGSGPSLGDPDSAGSTVAGAATGLAKPTATVINPVASSTVGITPTFTGTATNLSTVRIYIDGNYVGSTLATGGTWSYTSATLSGGAHTMYVIPVFERTAGDATSTRNFTVDATAPAAPAITNPAGNISTNVAQPTISGTAEANSTVRIYNGATLVGTTTASGGGAWSVQVNATLSIGTNSITARATDPYGNQGPASAARVITYDTTAPTVTIAAPAEAAYLSDTTPDFSFSANEAGTATCQIDSGSQVSCSSVWTASAMSDGAHSVTIRVTDAAGNTGSAVRNVTIDSTLPTISIVTPATDGQRVANATPQIGFTVSDANAQTNSQCRVDGGSFVTCTTPWTAPSLSQGAHSVEVRHTDRAGNQRTVLRNFVVDTVAPTITVNAPAQGDYVADATPQIDFTVNDANVGTNSTCQVDASAPIPCASGDSWPSTLSQGAHTLVITHTDAAGNSGASSAINFTVDTVTPIVAISAPAGGATLATDSPQIQFSVTDANSSPSSTCKIDSAPAVACTSPFAASGLSQGSHTILVTHADRAGNSASSSVTFTVDSQAPGAPTISASPNNPTNSTTANFSFSGDVGSTLQCNLDAGGWSTCTSPASYSSLAPGSHNFQVRQIDGAGNISAVAQRSWVIDTTPPPAPNVAGPDGVSGVTTETISFYSAELPVSFTCSFDGGAYAPCTSPVQLTGLANGAHSYSVISTDPAGNSSSPTTLNWTTNNTALTVSIDNGPAGNSGVASGDIYFSASKPGSTFQCSLDGAAFATCSSPFSYSGLSNATHDFRVFAENGPDDSPIVQRIWTVDTIAPSLSVSSPANASTTAGSVTVSFTATDSNGSVAATCQLDSDPAAPCSSGLQLNGLSHGAHTLTVTATDLAGNVSTVVRNWNVDVTPPNTTITATPTSPTSNASVNFSFSSSEGGSSFQCAVDGGSFSSCTSPHSVSVSEGTHTFSVRAIDVVGNVDPTPASSTWRRDTTPPSAPWISNQDTDPVRILNNGSFLLTGTAEPNSTLNLYVDSFVTPFDTASVAPDGNWFLSLDDFVDGTYTVRASATDQAGNTGPLGATLSITIDTANPSVSISAPAPSALVNEPNISFSATDATALRYECGVDDLTNGYQLPAFEECTAPTWRPTLISGRQYRALVRAFDLLENYDTASVDFTYDSTPPARPAITSPSGNISTNASPVAISGTAESGSTVRIYVNGNQVGSTTASGGTWNHSFSPDLAERVNAYEVHVTATDAAGNTSENSLSRMITVDRTQPAVPTIAAPVQNATTSNPQPTFSGTAEASSTLQLTIDASTVNVAVDSGGNWSHTPGSSLSNGAHTASARALDAAGNLGPATATRNFTVDNAPPSVAIASPVSGSVVASADVTISFSASDNGSFGLDCTLDGNSVTPCAAPSKAFTGLSEGSHTFVATATDTAGNVASATTTFTVDTIAPDAPVINDPEDNSYTNAANVVVAGTAEAGSTVKLTRSGGGTTNVTATGSGNWSHTYASLPDGTYSVSATATDAAGHESAADTVTFTIDRVAPSAPPITAPANGSELQSVSTIGGSAEIGAVVTVTVGSETKVTIAGGSGAWSVTLDAPLAEGMHTASATQTDSAGNTSTAGSSTFRVDNTAPSIAYSAPAALTNDNTPTASFTVTDASSNLTTTCSVGSDAPVSCTSPWTTGTLSDGPHTIHVTAVDGAGNSRTEDRSVTVDTTAPNTQFTGTLPGDPGNDATPTFEFESTEAGGTFECSLDAAPFTSCTSPHTTASLGQGAHTFAVRARDAAGNADASPATHSFSIDTIAPAKPVVTGTSDPASDNTPLLTGTAEAGSTVTVYRNGNAIGVASWNGGVWEFTPGSAIPDGTHLITARAVDAAGNVSVFSDAYSLTIDAVAPTVSITGAPDELSNDPTPTFTFSASETATFQCSIDGAPATSCGSPLTTTTLSDGDHTFSVTATDTSTNVSNPATHEWTIDTTAPVASVTGTGGNPAGFQLGTSETGVTAVCTIQPGSIDVPCSAPGSATAPSGLTVGSYTFSMSLTDAAGNIGGTESVSFTVDPPVVDPPTPPTNPDPPVTPPQEAPTCAAPDGTKGVPATVSLTGARVSRKTLVNFTISSDQFAIVRVTLKQGSKKLGTAVRANAAGSRQVVVKLKKAPPKNASFSVRVSTITMTGGKAGVDATMTSNAAGAWTIAGATGQSQPQGTISCGKESGAKSLKVKMTPPSKLKAGVKNMVVKTTSSDYAVATITVVQAGKTITRQVFVLRPGKAQSSKLRTLGGAKLAKGKATLQISTFSVDGVRQNFKKSLKVR